LISEAVIAVLVNLSVNNFLNISQQIAEVFLDPYYCNTRTLVIPSLYPMRTGGTFPGGKAAGA
jgi:hypothetical protein